MELVNNKLVLLVPYFGKLPSWFELWLKSAKSNSNIDFILFTDCDVPPSDNIIVENMTFEEFVTVCQSKFSFPICLERPYKICDFRPAFGLIFEGFIKDYSHWGHCDTDLIFGDLNKFINLDTMMEYDRIYTRGHLSIFKNSNEMNSFFKSDLCKSVIDYNNVFSTNYPCHFDEHGGSSLAFIKSDHVFYDEIDFSDVYYHDFFFRSALSSRSKQTRWLFSWDNGVLLQHSMEVSSGIISNQEIAYVHLQKRNMDTNFCNLNKLDRFSIIPNKFVEFKGNFIKSDFDYNRGKIRFYSDYLLRRFKDIKFKVNNGYFAYKKVL